MLYSCTHTATVGVKELIDLTGRQFLARDDDVHSAVLLCLPGRPSVNNVDDRRTGYAASCVHT